MKYRQKVGRTSSRKEFSRSAGKVHPKNMNSGTSRGGGRL